MPNRAAFSNARAPCGPALPLMQYAHMKQSDSRDELTLAFELGIYELGRSLYPRNARVLDGLVTTYAAVGRHEDSLQTVGRLIELEPQNPRHHYNRACNLCRLGLAEDALRALLQAIEMGFDDFEFLTKDADLALLHEFPKFHEFRKRALIQRNRRT
jgi:tetratricopeptide (TPR) repeat protein